jgi:hypothetical protein
MVLWVGDYVWPQVAIGRAGSRVSADLKSEVPGEAAMVLRAASAAMRQPSWCVAPSMCSSDGSTCPRISSRCPGSAKDTHTSAPSASAAASLPGRSWGEGSEQCRRCLDGRGVRVSTSVDGFPSRSL